MEASIANRCQCKHNAVMLVTITIRNVPEQVRDQLAIRAALQRLSMQEFLRGELERIASRPSVEMWLQNVRDRKSVADNQISPSDVLLARDQDRP